MSETTYGWNLEMQMRAAAAGLRIREVPVDHRCRRGGVSKVSGNLVAGMHAAWKIATTFVRLSVALGGPRRPFHSGVSCLCPHSLQVNFTRVIPFAAERRFGAPHFPHFASIRVLPC